VGHAHVARPSQLQQPMIRERSEPASCDASVKYSVKRSVFLCSKMISSALRLNFTNRGARVVMCRVESRRDERGGGARVWHFSSHSLTKWCNTPSYMLVYISPNFLCGTKLSSHLLLLCSQQLGLHVTDSHGFTHMGFEISRNFYNLMWAHRKRPNISTIPPLDLKCPFRDLSNLTTCLCTSVSAETVKLNFYLEP
jgi:hypothetical protein